jgi:hypothetical protein
VEAGAVLVGVAVFEQPTANTAIAVRRNRTFFIDPPEQVWLLKIDPEGSGTFQKIAGDLRADLHNRFEKRRNSN